MKKEVKKTEHFWTVIVILFWLVVKWNFLSLFEFKGDIRNFFSCSYYEIWRKPLTEDFILGLMIFEIILIIKKFFFRIWGFRGIGNIFLGGLVLFWGIGGWRENRTDIHPIGLRLLRGRRQTKQFYRSMKLLRAYLASIFFSLEFRGWNKRKKAWPTPKFYGWCLSFSHDDVLNSCVIWQSETNLGKARCLYIGSHEGSWLNWKETRRGFDQVKHVSSRAWEPMDMETET